MASSRRARRITLETLEDRAVPAWAVSLVGNAVTFTHDADFDAIYLSKNIDGYLEHRLPDPQFAGLTDLNPQV